MIVEAEPIEMNTVNLDAHTSLGLSRRAFAWIKLHAKEQNLSIDAFLKQELNIPENWLPGEKIFLETRGRKPKSDSADAPVSLIQPAIRDALQRAGGSQTSKVIIETIIAEVKEQFGPEWMVKSSRTGGWADRTRLEKLISAHFDIMIKAGEVCRPVRGLWQLNKR